MIKIYRSSGEIWWEGDSMDLVCKYIKQRGVIYYRAQVKIERTVKKWGLFKTTRVETFGLWYSGVQDLLFLTFGKDGWESRRIDRIYDLYEKFISQAKDDEVSLEVECPRLYMGIPENLWLSIE